jgi:hypothetical protein
LNIVTDLHHCCKGVTGFASQTIGTDTTTAGEIIDTQGFQAAEWFVQSGTITDGDYTFLIHEGDDAALADAALVTGDELLGGAAAFALTEDDTVKRLGSLGKKRYQRLSIVSANTTSGGVFSAVAVKVGPRHMPVADD